ncbi:MAG: electron transfer flavoprotein subunit beta/FixA family protein [Thalassotalea sp.]
MKILVAVKRVIDYNVKIRVQEDNSNVDLTNVKMAMNPFCEIAVEEAIRLKESGVASEVVVVTIGNKLAQEQLRSALALGADRAIHIETELQLDSLNIAKLLHTVVKEELPELIIVGKQAIDSDNNQTGQMLAALADLPQATFASKLVIENKQAIVTREVDGGLQTLALNLPALVTTDLRLNVPRYAKLPDIMKAKRKPLTVIAADELGINLSPRTELLAVNMPKQRTAGITVASVDELIDKLKNEAKVIL